MGNTEDKNQIITNLRNLKDQNEFKGISVTEDYTLAERRIIKEYTDMEKEYDEKESLDSKYIWRVRGTPKNGL